MMKFWKAQGLGNDFAIIDIAQVPDLDWSETARRLSDRRLGIGFDQLILFSGNKVWFYNADGSEAESCGNGTRCLALLKMKTNNTNKIILDTKGGVLPCLLEANDQVKIQMPRATEVQEINLKAQAGLFAHKPIFVRVGNPHLVCFAKHLEDLDEMGPILERHNLFPGGVNVSFAQVKKDKGLILRVWERGTGLTPACGSGACASVVAALKYELITSPITVHQEGGDLTIEVKEDHILMTGPAAITYEGNINLQNISNLNKQKAS